MAAKGKDEAISGLLRESLAAQTPGEQCPEPELLAACYERSLDKEELSRWQLHFSNCAHCRKQLALIARSEEVPNPEPEPAWLWDWRWFVATAAALAIVAYIGVRKPALSNSEATRPSVALSEPLQRPDAQSVAPAPLTRTSPDSPRSSEEPKAKDALSASTQPTARLKVEAASPQSLAKNESRQQNLPLNGRNYGSITLAPPAAENAATAPATPSAISQSAAEQTKQSDATAAASPKPQAAPLAAQPDAPADRKASSDSSPARMQARLSAAPANGASATTQTPSVLQPRTAVSGGVTGVSGSIGDKSTGTLIRTPNSQTMWRITDGPFIERTTNSGAAWERQALGTSAEILAGSAPGDAVCWLVGRGGTILVTTNARVWTKISAPISADFIAVAAQNAQSAIVTSGDGRTFATEDAGKTWTAQPAISTK